MPTRIDVELTSAREDGTWTWRAAGARHPRGSVDASLVYEGAQVGDVVRADADFGLDGIVVTRLHPPREEKPEPERLEVIGPPRPQRDVTASLAGPRGRAGRDRPGRGRPERAGRDRERGGAGERERGEGRERRPGTGAAAAAGRPERRGAAGRPAREGGKGGAGGHAGGGVSAGDQGARRPAPRRGRQRLVPASKHRSAALSALPPEQRAVAEQVLRGGMPAVRQAIAQQNAAARAEGRPEVPADPLVSLAEELMPRLKVAAWRDRAEAALSAGDDLSLRDLRSVVTSADAGARDDETRLLAAKLRESLDRRVSAIRQRWVDEMAGALDGDKILQALRASARPPDPGARFPAELAVRLSREAGAAMAPDTPRERWAALLDAVASSPVRRTVKPAGLPANADSQLLETAKRTSGRVPALAGLLGIPMPPPPAPPPSVRSGAAGGSQTQA